LVMPLIFKVEYMDGTSEEIRVPAEIWRYNNFDVSKLIITRKEAKTIVLDPNLETADADLSNNFFPRRAVPTRFQIFKSGQGGSGRSGQNQPRPAQPMMPATTTNSANITGNWTIAVDAGGQTISLVLNLTQEGGNVTGTIESLQGAIPITSGTFQNGGLTLKTTAPIAFTVTGQISGNTISGNVASPQGTTTFTGSKTN